MISDIGVKLITMGIVFTITVLGYIMAFFVTRKTHMSLSILNLFSGATFLSVCFIHLIPELSESAHDLIEYPFAYVIVVVTFFAFWIPHHSHDLSILEEKDPECHTSLLGLVIGLGFHSIVAGISLGMTSNATITLGVAISLHKLTEAAAFALSVMNANRKNITWILWLFPLFTPIGIGIGIGIQNIINDLVYAWIFTIVQAISVGCFLFVSIIEILLPELGKHTRLPFRIAAILLGVGLISAIALIPHHHTH